MPHGRDNIFVYALLIGISLLVGIAFALAYLHR
jgi:hypothetical protein